MASLSSFLLSSAATSGSIRPDCVVSMSSKMSGSLRMYQKKVESKHTL